MEGRGELCLQEEAARLWEAGLSEDEIARKMGVDQGWVEGLISMLDPEDRGGEAPPT